MRSASLLLVLLLAGAASAQSEIRQFGLPEGAREPVGIGVDGQGRVWSTLEGKPVAAWYDPASGEAGLVEGEEDPGRLAVRWSLKVALGSVWIADQKHLHRIDLGSRTLRSLPLPEPALLPGGIHATDDGRLWVAIVAPGALLELDPVTEQFTAHPVEDIGPLEFDETPWGLLLTATYAGTYAKLEPEAARLELGPRGLFAAPVGIVDDGTHLWLGEHGSNTVARYAFETGDILRLPTTDPPNATTDVPITGPSGVLQTDDGAIWFAEHFADRVGRIDPQNMTLHEFEVETPRFANTQFVAADAGGRVWFAVYDSAEVGYVAFGGEPVPGGVPMTVRATAGETLRLAVDFRGGEPRFGSSAGAIEVREEGGAVVVDVAAGLGSGTYPVAIGAKTERVIASQYVLVEVVESRWPLWAGLGVVVVAAVAAVLLAVVAARGGRR